jgi:hypothetical protein
MAELLRGRRSARTCSSQAANDPVRGIKAKAGARKGAPRVRRAAAAKTRRAKRPGRGKRR